MELPEADYEVFLSTARKVCAKMNVQPVPSFLEKLVQTYEMMIVRHGFMLVGDPFSGQFSNNLVTVTVIFSGVHGSCLRFNIT